MHIASQLFGPVSMWYHLSWCRVVGDQIKAGLKPYADMKGTKRGRQQLVKLQVCCGQALVVLGLLMLALLLCA